MHYPKHADIDKENKKKRKIKGSLKRCNLLVKPFKDSTQLSFISAPKYSRLTVNKKPYKQSRYITKQKFTASFNHDEGY